MKNLLNAFTLFGHEFPGEASDIVLAILLAQILLIIITVIVIAVLIYRTRGRQDAEPQPMQLVMAEKEAKRTLVGVSLDLASVKTAFKVGEAFTCEGLIINAFYSAEPYKQAITDPTLLTSEQLRKLEEKNETPFCYVIVPDTSAEGKYDVRVVYGVQSTSYSVTVEKEEVIEEIIIEEIVVAEEPVEEAVEEPVVVAEPEPVPEPVERKLIGLKLNTDLVRKAYVAGDAFSAEGLIVVAIYNVEPYTERVTDYTVSAPDLSKAGSELVTVGYQDQSVDYLVTVAEPAPVVERALVGISLNTDAVRKAYTAGDELDTTGLIVYANYNVEPLVEEITEGYEIRPIDMTQVGAPTVLVSYQGQTIGYQITVSPAAVVIEEEPEVIRIHHDPVVIEEESYEGGTLRYDKSFTARLIQSDDDTKNWYTELKNDMLSYKKVKDRMSWKRETYRVGRQQFAKLGFRGKTLCIFLPLNPAGFGEDSKYKIEDVSDNAAYTDTPVMYRIKNERRVKYAKELIALVAGNLGAARIERISEDYYLPYEGIYELINKGLVKRNIKSKEDEAFGELKKNDAPKAKKPVAAEAPVEEEIAVAEEPIEEAPVAEEVTEAPVEEVVEEVIETPVEVAEEPIEEAAPACGAQDPVEEPVAEEVSEEPAEEPVAEEVTEEPAEEPVAEEVTEEPVEEPEAVEEIAVAEEPAAEEPAEEPVEEPAEEAAPACGAQDPVEEPVAEEVSEEPAEEPVAEEVSEEPAEEPVAEEVTEEPVEEEIVEEPEAVEEIAVAEEPAAEEPAEEPVEEPAEEPAEASESGEASAVEEAAEEPAEAPAAGEVPAATEAASHGLSWRERRRAKRRK